MDVDRGYCDEYWVEKQREYNAEHCGDWGASTEEYVNLINRDYTYANHKPLNITEDQLNSYINKKGFNGIQALVESDFLENILTDMLGKTVIEKSDNEEN